MSKALYQWQAGGIRSDCWLSLQPWSAHCCPRKPMLLQHSRKHMLPAATVRHHSTDALHPGYHVCAPQTYQWPLHSPTHKQASRPYSSAHPHAASCTSNHAKPPSKARHLLETTLAVTGTAVPPPPHAGHGLLPVPRHEAQPTSPSLHRVQGHSTSPVPSQRGHSAVLSGPSRGPCGEHPKRHQL